MDKEQVQQIVNEAVELFLEGGPGSGRYPAGSGKNPTLEDNVARAERASKKAEKTGKSDDYARSSGRHMKAYLSLRDNDPETAKKHYLKAEEHGVMARSTQTMGQSLSKNPNAVDVSREATSLSLVAMKTTNANRDERERAHTAAGDAHEKAAQHIRDEIAAKRLAANEELKARSHVMSASFHWSVVNDSKNARKAAEAKNAKGEEELAIEYSARAKAMEDRLKAWKDKVDKDDRNQTPEERTRRTKNAIRFLARQRRDNNPDW